MRDAVLWLQRTARAALAPGERRYLIAGAAVAGAALIALLIAAPLGNGARIELGGVAFSLPPQAERVLANVSIKNVGSLPALVIGSNSAFILTSKAMTGEEEETEWDHLGDAAQTPGGAPQRLEAGAQWPDYAVVKTLERNEYQAFLSGSRLIYFLVRVIYRDESLAANKRRITEACYYYVKDPQRPRACRGHNRRYVAD
jgi:hypothetical protein